jgi:pimeloyl-ACP methyl ester carboxylesterase
MKFFAFAFATIATASSLAASARDKAPSPDSRGKVYQWKSADGLSYEYILPKSYDPEAGAALTFVLHGSNLSHTWGFANHKPGEFRPDDIVVCPDGTTANGRGGFNFLDRAGDIERFAALQAELEEALKVTSTFLYGHSQGSFFALHYAGARPESVDGVLAHASGAWAVTRRPEANQSMPIVFMHGTKDPVVPYGQSLGGMESYQKSGYKNVRLRSLEGWGHWPAENNGPVPHASRQLAWIEGMSSDDPKRIGAAFRALNDAGDKEHRDFHALYHLSARIADMPDIGGGKAAARAKQVMASIDQLAQKHITSMRLPSPDEAGALEDEAWIGHLPMFLRSFSGAPSADKLAADWADALKAHKDAAIKHFSAYRTARDSGDKAGAFNAGLEVLSNAYLSYGASSDTFFKAMETWAGDRSLDLSKDDTKAFKSMLKDYRSALEDGAKAFAAENKRARI